MIGEIINNSALNSKMHAKMKNFLRPEDYDRMVNMHSVSDIAEMLKNIPKFKTVLKGVDIHKLHRAELESILHGLLAKDIRSFLSFSRTSAKFFLNIFSIRSEIEGIKVLMRRLNSNEDIRDYHLSKSDSEFYKSVDFTALANAKDFDEFVEVLKPTIYYEPLKGFKGRSKNAGNFEIEAALDKFYQRLTYSYMSKFLSKAEAKAVQKIFDIDTDIENIMFILRAKLYYKMDKEMIYLYLSDHAARLKEEEIRNIIDAEDDEEIKKAVRETAYGDFFNGPLKRADAKIAEDRLKRHRRMFRQSPYSIELVLYYIERQEIEIKNITMAIEGVRYGLEPRVIKSYLL